jgi:hypothetical protein
MDAMKNGFIDPAVGMQRIDMGGLDKLYEDLQLDQRQAQRENIKMSTGQPLNQTPGFEFSPNAYDNHALHVDFHNRFRKQQQFEILPDQLKQIFEQHVQLHQQALMATMMPPDPNNPGPPVGNPQQQLPNSGPSPAPAGAIPQ